jgi:hypothetical protein
MKIKLFCILSAACLPLLGWAGEEENYYTLTIEVDDNCGGGLNFSVGCHQASTVTGQGYGNGLLSAGVNGKTETRGSDAVRFSDYYKLGADTYDGSATSGTYTQISGQRAGGSDDNSDSNDKGKTCLRWSNAQFPVGVGKSSGSTLFTNLTPGCWYSVNKNYITTFFKREGDKLYTSTKFKFFFVPMIVSPGDEEWWVDNDIPCTGDISLTLVKTYKTFSGLDGITYGMDELDFKMIQGAGKYPDGLPIPLNYLYGDGNGNTFPVKASPGNIIPEFTCKGGVNFPNFFNTLETIKNRIEKDIP